MKRSATATLLAVGLALAAAGCGVQSTGVNVAQTVPFDAPGSSSSQSSPQSAAMYQMMLYFIPVTNGLPRPEIRGFATKPGIDDLVKALKTSDDESLVSWVPQDLTLTPSASAHQYYVSTTGKLNSYAQDQLACTFSDYWRHFPDPGAHPSVSFILPDGGGVTGWNDCTYLLGGAPEPKFPASSPTAAEPGGM